ncbi:hypothetical protein OBK24_11440 [Empedobacter falsenii]
MDKRVQDRIEEKLQNGFQLKAGQVVEKAGDIFKGIAGYAILAVLIYFITLWILNMLVGLVFPISMDEEEIQAIASSGDPEAVMEMYQEIFSSTSAMVSIFLTNILSAVLYPVLYSIYTMAYKYDYKKNPELSDIFIHYKDGKFLNLFLVTLVVQIVGSIGLTLYLVPGFIVYTMWMLAVPLIIFASADVKEALNYSMKLAFKNFGSFFVVLLLGIAIIILGFILCCVGLIPAIPFVYVMMYILYREVVGFDDQQSEIEQIGTDIYKDNPYMK